ncbi:EF-hand calcium-binding domain-containing protein 8 [Elgaria multicarinata webbii]|uniref:EF-hand calcium-binding domain-containing protein 8 n=1 Tax=Elgaria multicarinata webbii TaxID=159646 RepID=UPI002FCD0AFF
MSTFGKSTHSAEGSLTSSRLSTPQRLSIHPSVTWGSLDSEGDLGVKQQSPAIPIPPKLPGILSKAGRECSSHRHLMKIADLCDEARSKKVEDQINYDHLRKLERMFHEADTDGGGGLDIEEFRKAMKKIMGNISDEDIDVIFMKVDTNCDGSVDWEEYLNYMLREYRGKDDMLKNKMLPEFQTPMTSISVAHTEEIVQIQFFPNQSRGIVERKEKPRKGVVRSTPGRFLTVSRDGILHYWSDTFKMLRTVYLDQTKRRHSLKLWVTDMLCLPNINLLAVATTDQDIEFFDIGGNKCDRVFTLVDLDGCATAMDYWTDGCKGVFCVGDVKGNVLIFTSTDVVMNGLFNIRSFIGGLARVPVQILMKGKTQSYKNFTVPALHGDWCQQIRYIPQLNVVASCTPADKTAMALTSLPLHNIGKTQSALIVLKKGILCFDYSSEMNILVTGGYEPLIRVWNPYVTSSPITHMKGHATAVTHIVINGHRNTIVSISKDKNIRVWDLLDHFCLQSIHGRNVPLGNYPISAAYYHQSGNFLVCATYTIGLFFGTEFSEAEIKSHDQPICCVLYNKNFKEVMSGCYSGIISVWDILSGQKMMEFPTAPEHPVEITAMTFDAPERRLITALKNGSIKLWNFNNGACLIELPFEGKNEINCILYMNHKIFVAGWSKRVTWYLDTKEENKVIECKHWKSYHSDDILCMDSYSSKLLVTASCDGDIVLWNVNSGQAFCRFNASESPLVLLPKREFSVDAEGPALSDVLKKGVGVQSKSGKKHWAHTKTMKVPTSSPLPPRPASAHVPPVSSLHGRSPGSALLGGRFMQHPQVAWNSEGSSKSGHSAQALGAAESRTPKKDPLTWQEEVSATQDAIEKVLFLNTRERGPNTAILLTSCAGGYIYAWAVGSKGGMMGKFRGAHGQARDTVVCSMSTDDKDLVLFTGDSLGYIKIWDIMNYCTVAEAGDSVMDLNDGPPPEKNRFCDLIPEYCRIPAKFQADRATRQVHSGWVTSLVPPTCLSSWRGHLKNIVSIRYVERFRVILTSSHDCTIKLWMLTGKHVGTFGQSLWRLGIQHMMEAEVPEEIRRVGSLHTLKVLHEGRQPHWESTRSIVQTLSQQKRQQSLLMDFLHVKSSLNEDAASRMQELIQKETRIAQFTDDQIEAAFQKWEESGKQKSDILGRAYKQKVPRPLLKQLPEMKASVSCKDQPRIYHCIQYTDLHPMIQLHVPEILAELQQVQAATELRNAKKSRKWSTLTGLLIKPTLKSYMMRKHAQYTKE